MPCACSSEIGTCIINDDGGQAAYKNNENTRFFLFESRQTTFYTCVLKVYINFQRKKKNFKKKNQNQRHYTFNNINRNVGKTIVYILLRRGGEDETNNRALRFITNGGRKRQIRPKKFDNLNQQTSSHDSLD
jgi:hypothetical protein